ncbi:short-chain alcohol dehydrogenase-like protein [Pigmentiphaga litoralis]|uniref:SDR family NAD(P)-dependent oxidoreductase n=1 Tax=Pigmentiphaga litoralis TaxID=516702 RepID=UPI0016725C85|nr:SDR family oxidoreductase [Pigmentiphaga litoralis]GGX29539.1 short-chain alcohol dehydrogenase-like protein [Pigmentiphaga litoralis]
MQQQDNPSSADPARRGGRLHGKSALITGGGGGIGAATARVFCAEGASVMLVDASEDGLARTAAALRDAHPTSNVLTCVADVSDADRARDAVAQAIQRFGGLDILVNNAAMRNYDALADVTPAAWQAMVAVNLIGPSNYIAAALPALRASGKGSVVTVSSCYAVTGRKGMGLYDTTKAGLLAMTRTLACEEAAHGVRANALCPGSTLTDFHVGRAQASGKSVEVLKTQRQDTSMLGRWASPEEIAWPILWLASDEASFITGATLMVDGGLSAM